MAKAKKEVLEVMDIAEKMPLDSVFRGPVWADSPEVKPLVSGERSHWRTIALYFLFVLALAASGGAFYAFDRVATLKQEMKETMEQVEQRIQRLDSSISFDSTQKQLLLGIRDEILKANSRISLGEAYQYAQFILRASEKYPTVDPLMFLAIGIAESGYDRYATSRARARGIYQIWPSTGRLLAQALNWDYQDEMLYDPEKNTEMAALYLDILFSTYNDVRMVLAEYNGGPLNAGYLRADSNQTAAETREYVLKVLDVYQRLKDKFDRGIDVRLELMHKESTRDGKTLGEPRQPRPAGLPSVKEAGAPAALQ